uniref:Coatomer WD associated region domain-containing protein n=1 Tax=Panagrolaimus sp. ES5 TaxID=591445 RepID=A0AC34GFA3_9BILA
MFIKIILLLSVLEYQTAVMRRDFDLADKLLNKIPKDQRTRVAHFLEKQGFKKQALAVSVDAEHRFELALNLGELDTAYELATQAQSDEKWKQLSQAANLKSNLMMAAECMGRARDYSGLLVLASSSECMGRARDYSGLLVLASSSGSSHLMDKLAKDAHSANEDNISFFAHLLTGNIEECLNVLISNDRLPEAAFFAHTYCPSKVPLVVSQWREKASRSLAGVSQKNIGESLADPIKYENLFPGFDESTRGDSYLQQLLKIPVPASQRQPTITERNLIAEMQAAI